MKSGELNKVARAFAPLMPLAWRQVGKEFFRRESSWVQVVAFNPSRFSEEYVPRCSFEFLYMPGLATGAFLGQELRHSNGAQRWVRVTETPSEVFEEMTKQFRPALLSPLIVEEIERLLSESMSYWPHAYALSIMSAQAGDKEGSQRYLKAFSSVTAGKPYPWIEARRQELVECLKLIEEPLKLKARLDIIEVEKLRALKCDGKL